MLKPNSVINKCQVRRESKHPHDEQGDFYIQQYIPASVFGGVQGSSHPAYTCNQMVTRENRLISPNIAVPESTGNLPVCSDSSFPYQKREPMEVRLRRSTTQAGG